MRNTILFCVLALSVFGCASSGVTRPYHPVVAPTTASPERLLEASALVGTLMDWSEVKVSRNERKLSAISNSNGPSRDLIVVEAAASGELAVSVQTQLKTKEGWITPKRVDPIYSYSRENHILDCILALVLSRSEQRSDVESPSGL